MDADPVVIRSTTVTRQVADAIRQSIERGDYEPGATLPAERTIAQNYGVSLASVRQSLAMLVAEGLVIKVNGKGTVVRGKAGPPQTITRPAADPWTELTPTGEPFHHRETSRSRIAALLDIPEGSPLYVVDQAATHTTGRTVLTCRTLASRHYDMIEHRPDPFGPREKIIAALGKHHGPLTTTEYVRPLIPDSDERDALRLLPGDLLLEVVRVTRAPDGSGLLAECERYGEGIQLAYPIA